MEFTFIRHGETDWNLAGRLLGHSDRPLNNTGIAQAHELARTLPMDFDALFSSPLQRAYQTAEIISARLTLPISAQDELQERDFGTLTGKTWELMQQESGLDLKPIDRAQQYDYHPYGGESAEDVKQRVMQFVETAKRGDHQKPLVVCHVGIIRMVHFAYGAAIPKIANASIHHLDL